MSIPDCQFPCTPRLRCNTLLCPSILCLLLAYFGHSSQNSPWVQLRCFNVKMNFLEKTYPSPESAAREQSPDLRACEGDWSSWQMDVWAEWSSTPPGRTSKKLSGKSENHYLLWHFLLFFSFEYDDHLKLTADFSPAWTDWGNPEGKPAFDQIPTICSQAWSLTSELYVRACAIC